MLLPACESGETKLTGVDSDQNPAEHQQLGGRGGDTDARRDGTEQSEDLTHHRRTLPAHIRDRFLDRPEVEI